MASNTFIASANAILSVAPDPKAYKAELIAFLQQQEIFQDYNFTGSNMSVLLDILAYNQFRETFYTSMIGSEMFLDTAQLRQSIVSHAKELNYVPGSRVSSTAYVDITVTGNNLPTVMTIPANYALTAYSGNGQTFQFLTAETTTIGSGTNWKATAVPVYEGRFITEYFVANTGSRYLIQSANIDISSIEVTVINSNTDSTNAVWTLSETVIGVGASSNVYFLQGYQDYYYEVTFGDGIIGNQLSQGNIIQINYRDTLGPAANGLKLFSCPNAVQGFTNVAAVLSSSVANNTGSLGGAERESNTSIQFSAPRRFATQGHAIVPSDFVTLITNKFPIVQTMIAYGGEDATPPQYGTIILSAVGSNGSILPNSIKNNILSYMSDKITLGMKLSIVDPDFFNIQINTTVTYNLNATTLAPSDIVTEVTNAISTFNSTNLDGFGTDMRFSKLVAAIDEADPSIVSNQTYVQMIKKLDPILGNNAAQNFLFSFGQAVLGYNEVPRFAYPVGFSPMISSSPFGFLSGNTTYNAYIQDDGLGNLYVYTIQANGNLATLQSNIGTVNYTSGNVAITGLIVQSLPNVNTLNIYARLANNDIIAASNQILLIDLEDVTITTNGIRL